MPNQTSDDARQAGLTQGSIIKPLVLFALPLLGSSLIQQLYNTVDIIFIGQLLGKEAAAAVGASSLLVASMVAFFTGASIGSNVLAARFFGSKQHGELQAVVSMAFMVSIAGGLALTLTGYGLAPLFLRWLNVPDAIYGLALEYLRIYIASLTSMAGYNIGAGVLRGLGDSRSPMIYQLIGGIVNIAANGLFIGWFHWGVQGSALATLFSQSLAAVLVFRRLAFLDQPYCLTIRAIRLKVHTLRSIMRIGVPAGIQAMLVTLSNLIVQNHINLLGIDSIAAFTAYFKVELFIYLPIVAIGQANITFTSQNIGACKPNRAIRGTRASIALGLGVAAVSSITALVFCQQAFRLFTKDTAVIGIGTQIAMNVFPWYFMYVFLEILAAFIRGSGKNLEPTLIILVNMCLIRPIYVMIISHMAPGAVAIAWVYPITWLTTSVCMGLYYLKLRKKW
ncbi:MATE family efflux transporter [Acetonema longum]|uniref:Putative Na+-driven multidrug efflux pump n=1 Tax=Acetonema longum DSM 6540 TaxID=1009370 RepID=F7NJC2_9FIRM|nr:MATE family efflux transporter [Acetonema longum]EGO63870.1 putative Na+-driven multidrug efflux pump [Acetonema longum DSM 6540]